MSVCTVCNATCYGYTACSSCNNTCYYYSACTCDNTCYVFSSSSCKYDFGTCSCAYNGVTANPLSIGYGYVACNTCNATCYSYTACNTCNSTCYYHYHATILVTWPGWE